MIICDNNKPKVSHAFECIYDYQMTNKQLAENNNTYINIYSLGMYSFLICYNCLMINSLQLLPIYH